MGSRLELHEELLQFGDNVYYQPPSNIKMVYPCIVYDKTGKERVYSNDELYLSNQVYQLTVIDRNPDSTTADEIEEHFGHGIVTQYFTVDNLNHTTIQLYY